MGVAEMWVAELYNFTLQLRNPSNRGYCLDIPRFEESPND